MFLLCANHDIGLCERHKDQCMEQCDPQPDERVKGCMVCDGRLLPRDDRARPGGFSHSESKLKPSSGECRGDVKCNFHDTGGPTSRPCGILTYRPGLDTTRRL